MKNFTPTLVFLFSLCIFNLSKAQENFGYNIQQNNHNDPLDYLEDNHYTESDLPPNSNEENFSRFSSIEYTFDGSWSPANPIGLATSLDDIKILSGKASISANTICNNLVVEAGASLTISAGVTLTTTVVDLYSSSTTYSNLISDGTIIGVVNYHRYTAQIGTNDLISSPLDGQLFETFALTNSDNLASSSFIRAFAPYVTSTGSYQNYSVITNLLTPIESGIGYRAATTDGSALTFTGQVRTTDVLDIPISDATAGGAWNLIGNPYASYIDFATFFELNKSELENTSFMAVYGYDGNASDGWTVWNQATIDSPAVTELIAPGQAFFVKAKTGGGLIDFTTDMRTIGSSDDFILGRPQQSPHYGYIKLDIEADDSNFETDIYFNSNASKGFDTGYDAALYGQTPPSFSIYTELVENNTGVPFAIQALNPESMDDVVIPLGLNVSQGHEVTISKIAGDLPEDINVYIEDTANNTFTLINTSDYVFTATEDISGVGRFYVRFEKNLLGTVDTHLNELNIYSDNLNKTIVVAGQLQNNAATKLYDVNGRMVMSTLLNSNMLSQVIDVSHLNTGIYIIEIDSEINGSHTQKLIIK